jgi:hypothetical protein
LPGVQPAEGDDLVEPVEELGSKWRLTVASSWSAPMLLVMRMTVLAKSAVRPCASVSRPASSTWSSVLKTSGWAFSLSSSSTTEYGVRRTAPMSRPPSS